MSVKSTGPVVAYSYIRFSSPEQARGDSLRRQVELAEDYCRRRGWTLDASLNLRDLGVSAFRGDNALVGNLGVFLAEVKRGTVTPGSALICESIDRISRQGIDEGYDLIKGILKANVRLVTLAPEREFDREATRSLSKGALEIQLILERAAEESERKSERVSSAWTEKRRKAAENGLPLTRGVPAWLKVVDGKFVVDDRAAAAVRLVYKLATDGFGLIPITQRLNRDGVPAIGRSKGWVYSYVAKLLKTRAVVGEHIPRKYCGKNKVVTDGVQPAAIKSYFPPIVTEAEWYAARAAVEERRHKRGRTGPVVTNLFSGLLRDAADGGPLHVDAHTGISYLAPYRAKLGTGAGVRFPLKVFERGILRELLEIDPRELLPGDRGADETMVLAGRLKEVEDRIAGLRAAMRAGDEEIEALVGTVRELEADRRDLTDLLAAARRKAANPLGESWAEAKSLLAALDAAPDPVDARTRLKAALRRVIESAWCLTVRRGRYRVMAVQIRFAGGAHRDYALACEVSRGVKVKALLPRSVKFPGRDGELDLRDPKHVAALEAALLAALDAEADPGKADNSRSAGKRGSVGSRRPGRRKS